MADVRVGDVGTIFRITLRDGGNPVDLTAASNRKLIFQKPDGTVMEKNASLTTDGEDGQMQYITVPEDIDIAGGWSWQARVSIGSGTWSSDIHTFRVRTNL